MDFNFSDEININISVNYDQDTGDQESSKIITYHTSVLLSQRYIPSAGCRTFFHPEII